MATDPICGMKVKTSSPFRISTQEETFYFCNRRCLEKFAADAGITLDLNAFPHSAEKIPLAFLRNKTFIVAAVLLGLCLLSYVLPILVPFRQSMTAYSQTIWWAVLLGLIIGGVIDHYVPRELFTYLLAQRKKRTVFYAVLLGFLMSVCNHGILAISIQLHKKGAATPAVIAFLLASPWANFPLTLMLIGFFGPVKAIYIIFSAIVIALVTGFVYQFLELRGWVEKNPNTVQISPDYSPGRDVRARVEAYSFSVPQLAHDMRGIFRGGIALSDMVLWWILMGTGLASLFGAYIPHDIFHKYMGPTFSGMLVTLLMATVIEICSEGTAPLAFEIFRQTGALGNSLVFLMAGVVTDYTEIGLIWHNVGRKAAMWLPVITVPQVMVLGYLANRIF